MTAPRLVNTGCVKDLWTAHTNSVFVGGVLPPTADSWASGSRDGDPTIRLWNPQTGEEIRTLTDHPGLARAVTFSPDCLLFASSGLKIYLWGVACTPSGN